MPIPKALVGDTWTPITARNALPIVVRWAQRGELITYGQLDAKIVKHGLGHHVMAVQYGYPAGAIGNALIELEKRWNKRIRGIKGTLLFNLRILRRPARPKYQIPSYQCLAYVGEHFGTMK